MSEKFVCSNCNKIVELDIHGRCVACNSEAVFSVERIQAALQKAQNDEIGWMLTQGEFESFVSDKEAKDATEAVFLASRNAEHPWYLTGTTDTTSIRYKRVTRDQWCDWVKSCL